MNQPPDSALASAYPYWKVVLVSVIFFHITASTFTSLGVALPFMIKDLGWSWSAAGVGFSVLSFMVGISGWLPALTLARLGTRATYAIGAVVMAVGFALLATTHSLAQYFLGAGFAGLGYTLCASVAGVAVVNRWLPHRREVAIGVYLTIGGLGGVAGPQLVSAVVAQTGTWRMHWWLMAGSILVLGLLAALTLSSRKASSDSSSVVSEDAASQPSGWTMPKVLRTPQFYIIVAALTLTLFGGVTTNTWAVTHMDNMGIPFGVAATALSTHALINAFSRAIGGGLSQWVAAKWLLASALVAEVTGMVALSMADNSFAIALFVIGEGYGFGMCLFATTILLVNYYGAQEAPKTMGTMHVITTIAMVGPVLGGWVADSTGSFAPVFQGYALVMLLCLVAVLFMQTPRLPQASLSPQS